ncbi:MAG: hypothetical protein GX254_05510 [Clostridiales bacterium]|jgi:tRNA/tmRNA/rRNA uracil-C5-methylase (TrmA/RlmC/RlmD family)|nr:hypothetical protein [Clostridiales bacterium]
MDTIGPRVAQKEEKVIGVIVVAAVISDAKAITEIGRSKNVGINCADVGDCGGLYFNRL